MIEFFSSRFFMPHGHCYLWTPALLWLQVVTNLAIGVAYVAIASTLWYLTQKAKGLLPFSWVYVAFATFIISCGLTHFMDVWVIWTPSYWLDGAIRALTAIASVITAILLFPLMPRILVLIETYRRQRDADHDAIRHERLLREAVTANASLGLLMLDEKQQCTFMNRAAEQITGFTMAEVQGRPLHELVQRRQQDGAPFPVEQSIINRALRERARQRGEDVFLHKDGRFFPVAFTASPIVRDGTAIGTVVEIEDISERVQARRALERSQQLLRSTMAAFPSAVAYKDEAHRFVDVNWAVEKALTRPRSEIIGKTLVDLGAKKDAIEAAHAHERQVMQTKQAVQREETTQLGEATLYHLHTAFPLLDTQGSVYGSGHISHDISELKRTALALQESEEKFRALADNISQLAWMTDDQGWIFWYNKRWFDYTGTTLEQMQGWGWQQVHHPDHVDRVTAKFKAHLQSGHAWEDTFPLRGADGTFRWFLSRARPIRDDNGDIVLWFGTNTDVDEQKRVQQELQDAITMREEFLSVASHELRTPLTALSIQLESVQRLLAKDESVGKDKLARKLETASHQSSRLATLVEGLLSVSRLTSGHLQLQLEELDMVVVAQDTAKRLAAMAERSGSVLRLQVPPSAPGRWDRLRIEQVLTNLITNALKYGAQKPIEVTVEARGEQVVLSVRDYGIGVSVPDQERIFGRFERAVSAQNYGGLGLGLYITRELVHAHGGDITVHSELGAGAIFTVSLPRVTAMPSDEEGAA